MRSKQRRRHRKQERLEQRIQEKSQPTTLLASRNINTGTPGFTSSGYHKPSLFNWHVSQKSGKTEVSESQQRTLSARAFDAYRNQDIARAIVTQMKTSVINVGLKLNPNIDGEKLGISETQEEELENILIEEFEIWTNECDLERTLDFEECQLLWLVNWFVQGNVLINTVNFSYPSNLYSLKVQTIDAERLCNPSWGIDTKNRYRGIEMNDFGVPSAYHILNAHPSEMLTDPKGTFTWNKIPAFDDMDRRRLLHIFEKDRIGSPIGYSGFASILERMKQVDRYADNELTASVISSWLTLFVESEKQQDDLNFASTKIEDPRLGLDANGHGKNSVELGPGAVIELDDGKKITSVNPARPNVNFEPYYKAMSRHIAAAIGLPLEEVLMIYSDSYSASRAAMLKAGKQFNLKRLTISKKALEPLYRLWFDEAVYRNVLPYIPSKYWQDSRLRYGFQKHQWLAVGHGAIDELGQARAAVERIKNNLSSLPNETALLTGQNYKSVIRQQAKAMRLLKKYELPWPYEQTTNKIDATESGERGEQTEIEKELQDEETT